MLIKQAYKRIACQKDVKTIPELPDCAEKGVRFIMGVKS